MLRAVITRKSRVEAPSEVQLDRRVLNWRDAIISLSPQRGEGLRALPLRQEYFVNVLCVQSKYNLLLD
jgi:hypothetical protein